MNHIFTTFALLLTIHGQLFSSADNSENAFLQQSQTLWKEMDAADSLFQTASSTIKLQAMTVLTNKLMDYGTRVIDLLSRISHSTEPISMAVVEDGFLQTINKLSSMTEEYLNREMMPESYEAYSTAINDLFGNFTSQTDREGMQRAFEQFNQDTSVHLLEGILNSNENVLQTFREDVKCNVLQIQSLCLRTVELENKEHFVEAKYCLLMNEMGRLENSRKIWLEMMKSLQENCHQIVEDCTSEWLEYAQNILDDVYSKNFHRPKPQLARKLYNALSSGVPQRSWGVWVYDKAAGFGDHTVASPNVHLMKWHENGKTVTVASFDEDQPPLSQEVFNETIAALRKDINDTCQESSLFFWPFPQKTGPYMEKHSAAKRIVMELENSLADEGPHHLSYAIQLSKGVVHVGAQGRSFTYELRHSCVRWPYKIFVFQ